MYPLGVALLPGVSRSGSTLAGGLLSGLNRKSAAKFSFMMSAPAIVGALIIDGKTAIEEGRVRIPDDIQGESMKGLLTGKTGVKDNWRKSAYYQYFEYPKWHNVQPHYGVRTDQFKLIHFYYNIDTWELYDLKKDPKEVKNIYNDPAYAGVVKELKAEIVKLQKQYGDTQSLEDRRKMTDRYMLRYEE